MQEMFNNCAKLKNIFINNLDTFLVENMFHIFYGCDSLENFDISSLILYKLKTEIKDLFGNIDTNPFIKRIYNEFWLEHL